MYILLLAIVIFLVYMSYENKQRNEERIVLIRELSIALKSKTTEQYIESIPDYKDDDIEIVKDELVPIESIEPEELLRAISK